MSNRSFWDKFWRDKHGRIVIFQMPSQLLLAWLFFTIISLLTSGSTSNFFWLLGALVLIVWSIIESLKGVNYFRKLLGLAVLIWSVLSVLGVGL
ncbi:MAG TPA: hypothetical protein VLF79_00630 [Candidatus Saccharimonadales bacterium]|nr:hypothetical protein [Candidatus Saccharimonadales bacterium]